MNLFQLLSYIISKSEQIEEEERGMSELNKLTMKQLGVIELIEFLDNPTLSEIAKKLSISKPSASAMLDKLEEKGCIKKIKSDKDRRSAHVHLTTKGKEMYNTHQGIHRRFAEKLTSNLTESEKDVLLVILNKAVSNLK